MNELTLSCMSNSLREIGLSRGDVVLVHSSLSKIGSIEGILKDDREGFASAVYNAFAEVLKVPEEGTLVVPTFTHEYARNNKPFIYEESPSEVGLFTEYIRKREDVHRSLHPINSFCGIGKHKDEICKDVSISCYGYNSVFERLERLGAKMVFLGCSLRHMTLIHHVEQIVGVPYVYMKAYFTPVYKDGNAVELPFLCCVRYLNGLVEPNDFAQFEELLTKRNKVRKTMIGSAKTMLVSMKDATTEACLILQKDPCFFLEQPFYMTE